MKSLVSSIVSGVLAGASAGSKGHKSGYGQNQYGQYGNTGNRQNGYSGNRDTSHASTTYGGYNSYGKPVSNFPLTYTYVHNFGFKIIMNLICTRWIIVKKIWIKIKNSVSYFIFIVVV